MKQLALSLLFCLAFVSAGLAQQQTYVNYGTVNGSPQIDATNVDNEGTFDVFSGSVDPSDLPYQFFDMLNLTNHNFMEGTPGFDFATIPAAIGQPQEQANFVNGNPVLPAAAQDALVYGSSIVEIWSTNIVNRGLLQTTDQGLLRVHGGSVDLAGGGLLVDTFGTTLDPFDVPNSTDGMITAYWGNTNNGPVALGNLQTSVTNMNITLGGPGGTNVVPTNIVSAYYIPQNFLPTQATNLPVLDNFVSGLPPTGYGTFSKQIVYALVSTNPPPATTNPPPVQWTGTVINPVSMLPTNWMAQVLFYTTNHNGRGVTTTYTNFGFSTIPPGSFGAIEMAWAAPATNVFGQVYTNTLYLTDRLAQNPTNNTFTPTNGDTTSLGGTPGLPTFQLANFTVSRYPIRSIFVTTNAFGVAMTNPPSQGMPYTNAIVISGTNNSVTNFVLSSYGIQLTPTNDTPLAGQYQTITNTPGRVEIVADGALNMNNTRVDSLGYVLVKAQHFVVSTNLSIAAPYSDLYLGSTNGTLTVASLTLSSVPRLVGTIDAYSMFWTNMVYLNPATGAFTVPPVPLSATNSPYTPTNVYPALYNVVMIDSHLSTAVSTFVENLVLTCTNAATNNVFIGTTTTNLDIYNIQQSIAFNTPNLTIEPSAELNLIMTTPTDWEGQSPNLQSLTNYGVISCLSGGGLFFTDNNPAWSGTPYAPFPPYQNFVNTNTITAPGIVVAANYVQNSGTLTAASGAVQIAAETAQLSGGKINALGSDVIIGCSNLMVTNLSLGIGRSLSLSITNSVQAGANTWSVNDGFNLLVSPVSGDLRSVAVTNNADTNAIVVNYWAAPDLGPTGFTSSQSCVLGELVLNGDPNSFFYFVGQNSQCGANPGVSNALYVDKLVLLNSAAATNSSGLANVVICSGMKIYFNSVYIGGSAVNANTVLNGANGGALVNATDSSGSAVFSASLAVTPASIGLNVALAAVSGATPAVGGSSSGSSAALLTWNTVPGATNYVYFKDELTDASWQVLTNFVSGSQAGTVSVTDPANVNGRFYKVQVAAPPQ